MRSLLLRVLIISCLLLLGIFFGFAWLDAPAQPTAMAQAPQAESQGGVVERWHGTVIEEQISDSYATDCPWVCPGFFHYLAQQEWYFEVQEDGTLTGYIRTEVMDYSYDQSKTNNSCGPVAETNYFINDCTFTGQLTQPQSTVVVHGKRELEQFTQRPVLVITAANVTQECQSFWTARGYHSETGAVVNKQESPECTRTPFTPQTFYIQTYEDGRAPQIDLSNSSRSGYLTATTEQPFLELDREFIERSIFLDQVSVEEKFLAKMNWLSPDGGWLSWKLANTETERVGPSDAKELPKPINIGQQGVGKKQLTAQAKTTLNKNSDPEVTQITAAPPPGWAGAPAAINATKVNGAVAYKNTVKFPEPAFEGGGTVHPIVPWLGGKKIGIVETQGSLSWEALSTSEGQGSLSGQTGFEVMNGAVIGSLGGRARVLLDESGVSIPEGGIDFGISGKIESDPEPLLKVVPSLRPAIIAIEKISSQAAAFINDRAKAKLELAPKLDFGFNFVTENDEIKFKDAEAKPGFGFKTTVEIKLMEMLKATASIGGQISATFKVPEPYFKEAALQGLIQAQIILYRWAWEGEKAWSVVVNGASAAIASADQLLETSGGSWQLLNRDYLTMPNYARWHGDDVSAQAEAGDELLVENITPLANPSLHIWTNTFGQTRLLQTWVHDDPNDPDFSNGEIMYSVSGGDAASWQNPNFVIDPNIDDKHDDFAPQAVTLTNNQRLFVWQRMDTPNPPDFNDDPAGYLSHWQIVAQNLSGSPALEELSDNGSFNYRHQLGVLSDGALAVWVNNPANQLIGDTANPDDILFARYTNVSSSWMTGTARSDVAGLLSLDLATNGDHAALIYALDTNNALTTTADQELFYVTWNGTIWSAPTRLTNNSVADENPELVLDAAGEPMLVWRQGGVLKFLQGGWNNAPTTLLLPGATERIDYELVQSSDGHLALVWQQVEPEDTRIGYALYDATHNRWSDELTLTPPAGAEGSMATSIAAGFLPADEDEEADEGVHGALVFAYQLAHVETITRTVNDVDTNMGVVDGVTIANIAQIGQHDLRVATQPLRVNLSVAPSDLSIPAADKIQAVIHNTGELAVENAPVVLHVGPADPVTGATQTQAQNIPLLAAGSVATLTFTVADQTLFMVEIDPQQTLLESDRGDNTALLGTDVAITTLPAFYSPHGSAVRALVNQNGNRYVSVMAPATLTLDTLDGDQRDGILVGESQFGFPLDPTDSVTLTAFISTTLLGEGRHHLTWTLDPAGTLGEINRSNNVAGTSIMILPDLAAVEDTIHFGTAPGNTSLLQMSVQNLGNWPNDATVVEIFDALPGEENTHSLLQLPIPSIEPGSTVAISGTLQLAGLPAASTGLSGIFIQLDPGNEVDESNENNNLIADGAVLESADSVSNGPLYMPSIRREGDAQ